MGTVTSGGRRRRVRLVEGEVLFASLEMCMVGLLVLLATEFYVCFFGGGRGNFRMPDAKFAHPLREISLYIP
jgi:hypothetical protein